MAIKNYIFTSALHPNHNSLQIQQSINFVFAKKIPSYHPPVSLATSHRCTGVNLTFNAGFSHSANTFCTPIQSNSLSCNSISKLKIIFARITRISANARLNPQR